MRLLIARRGRTEMIEAPDPVPSEDEVLIETAWSAVSAGTERQAARDLSLAPSALLRRARLGWDKIAASRRGRGWRATLAKIGEAAAKPVPLGYSASGRVRAVGAAAEGFAPGDFVVAVGPGAHHATLLCARRAFCAKLPRPELARDASAGALAAVALHARHRAGLDGSADAAVFGLGVIGLFMVQTLRTTGCRVTAFDPLSERRALAVAAGAEAHEAPFPGVGAFDAVFLCARADASGLLADAITLCRRRARVVVVGEFPLELPREAAYAREVELLVSAGYGDDRYAAGALPMSRLWTRPARTVAQNLETFLRGLEEGRFSVEKLNPAIRPFDEAAAPASSAAALTFYRYDGRLSARPRLDLRRDAGGGPGTLGVALAGPGRFAREVHLPNLKARRARFRLQGIVGHSPLGAREAALRFGAVCATCDLDLMLRDPEVAALVVATPHAGHAAAAERALAARKHVFVEKPLCVTLAEWMRLAAAARAAEGIVLFVGFNRRFAPATRQIAADLAEERRPRSVRYTLCQDALPPGEWAGEACHGGRFVGEACHAVDWICALIGAPAVEHSGATAAGAAGAQVRFADGSQALLTVRPRRAPNEPKERIEVACGDALWILRDFTDLEVRQANAVRARRSFRSKGHGEALDAFAAAVAHPPSGGDPFGFLASSRLVLELDAALRGTRV
ncbi:MAG: Gfo/Idh/MocA family oxidoreductase [Verrucomicrobiae bacterium]|nr:Gfo/Idh/MocA family oxidoreductase [Verrucomicrobiae bacterium]